MFRQDPRWQRVSPAPRTEGNFDLVRAEGVRRLRASAGDLLKLLPHDVHAGSKLQRFAIEPCRRQLDRDLALRAILPVLPMNASKPRCEATVRFIPVVLLVVALGETAWSTIRFAVQLVVNERV